jgi:hypothetical protein
MLRMKKLSRRNRGFAPNMSASNPVDTRRFKLQTLIFYFFLANPSDHISALQITAKHTAEQTAEQTTELIKRRYPGLITDEVLEQEQGLAVSGGEIGDGEVGGGEVGGDEDRQPPLHA